VFSIPATGQTPLTFSATGLPAGLTIAAATGIISGAMPAAGSYPVAVTVSERRRQRQRDVHAGVGQHLRADAARGWNSYDSFGASVTEQDMIDEAMR
jgi:alpha-galactosidase